MIKSYTEIHGWYDFEEIYQKVVDVCPDNVAFLEIGCWLGKSTAFMADAIRRSGKKIRFYTVDTFEGEDTCDCQIQAVKEAGGSIYTQFQQNIDDLGLTYFVRPIISKSNECLSKIQERDFWFIFIDGDHKYGPLKSDLNHLWPAIRKDGVFGGHDFSAGSDVEKCVMEFFSNKSVNLGVYNSSWIVTQ